MAIPEPPKSAVSTRSGFAGCLVLISLLLIGVAREWDSIAMVFILMLGTAFATALWDVVVEKVHLRPSTGLDWSNPRPISDISSVVLVKVVGLYATFGVIAFAYVMFQTYQQVQFLFYLVTLKALLPLIMLITPVYVLFTTRYMIEPRDKLWHFGRFVMGGRAEIDPEKVKDHVLCWTIKAFFLAFLFSIVPAIFVPILEFSAVESLSGIVPFFLAVVAFMFFLDVCFGTFGYFMTFRPLDSHIRTANPYLSAWVFALICYPPFTFIHGDGLLNYTVGGQSWSVWLADLPVLLIVWGVLMAVLTALYAWATVIFGIRFSNLTHRGIITAGPYRYFKHPAYLSKNIYWWFAAMPFLTTADDPMSAVRNSVLLLMVNGVYYMRAKTEEKHLMADPVYQAYSVWIAQYGVLPRLWRGLTGKSHPKQAEPVSGQQV